MNTTLLILLIVLDLGLVGIIYIMSKKQGVHSDLLADMTEERRLLSELRSSVKEELASAELKNKDILNKVSKIAAEAEQEVSSSGSTLADSMQEIFSELNEKFEAPLKELAKRQAAIEAFNKKLNATKESLIKIVTRGEKLVEFFDEKVPYEEVIKEIENSKYENCRQMLAQGASVSDVAIELGISKSEVQLISGFSG